MKENIILKRAVNYTLTYINDNLTDNNLKNSEMIKSICEISNIGNLIMLNYLIGNQFLGMDSNMNYYLTNIAVQYLNDPDKFILIDYPVESYER